MLSDNSPPLSAPDVKKAGDDPSDAHSSRRSDMRALPPIDTSSAACEPALFLPASMANFIPKPFPPSALDGVPTEYIIDQLHALAPSYWEKPETADCTIVVPVPHPRTNPFRTPENAHLPQCPNPAYESTGSDRRHSEPMLNLQPRITLKLHTDYLSAHSSFMRALFSGASAFDLINPASTLRGPTHTSSGQFTIPANRLPRLLPSSSPTHPVLLLPVPDPSSFHLLVHWMYFGRTEYIDESLTKGLIQWEGIARNVEYLGLPSDIKLFLGHWYNDWLHTQRPAGAPESCDETDLDIDDSSSSGSDDTDYFSGEEDFPDDTSTTSVAMDVDETAETPSGIVAGEVAEEEFEPSRGRDRGVRCLSWTSQYPDDGNSEAVAEGG